MGFYDVFANFYDASLEPLYAEHRSLAVEALALAPGSVVLDVPCGTGQSFDLLAQQLGPDGLAIGVDASAGMSRRAAARIAERGFSNVRVIQANAGEISPPQLEAAAGRAVAATHLHVFLGMSVFTDPEATFARLWQLLAPGGICVLVDVYAARLSFQGWMVNQLARAEIRRKFWEPLERVASGFERRPLPYRKQHGGQITLARGTKPR
jgi:ubiquinone/menaquinone biosynthesis C-methylase UbiE